MAKAKPVSDTAPIQSNGHEPDYRSVPLDRLVSSKTNPRKRFPESSITELAGSIREKGILEPLIVREWSAVAVPRKKGTDYAPTFEIVCGERRYRAAKQAGLSEAPCIVRHLTDDEVLDIQIHENLHREDVHPMDEAFGYRFLMEKIGADVAEVALRVGKSESYVLSRLKLNQLIPELQKDIEDGFITLSIGLEIAKYSPDGQRLIYGELYEDASWDCKLGQPVVTDKTDKGTLAYGMRTPHEIGEWAATNVLHLLAKAPFDKKSTNLRQDGLACVNCPDRTGANASLFESQIGKKDSCLDPGCYAEKIKTHIHITRNKIAHEASVEVSEVPIIKTFHGSSGTDYIGCNDFLQLTGPRARKDAKKCKTSVTAIDVDTTQESYAKPVEVCLRSSGCKTHWGAKQSAAPSMAKYSAPGIENVPDEAARIQRLERKEEIFDIRVSDIVRKRVFRMAAEIFANEFLISNGSPGFLAELLTKLWNSTPASDTDAHTRRLVVTGLMQDITDEPSGFNWTGRRWNKTDHESDSYEAISKLSERNQTLMLFLFVHGNKGNTYSDQSTAQAEVRELAEHYEINYRFLDAEARLEVATEKAKKHLDLFKQYLVSVENGQDVKVPRPFAATYKPKD